MANGHFITIFCNEVIILVYQHVIALIKLFFFRLRASRVLLVGIKGLGAEICKNLVLSGVKSVTIVDPDPVNEEDFVSQFLVQRQDLGKNVSVLSPGFRFFSFKRYCSFVSIWIGLCLMPMLWFNFIFG